MCLWIFHIHKVLLRLPRNLTVQISFLQEPCLYLIVWRSRCTSVYLGTSVASFNTNKPTYSSPTDTQLSFLASQAMWEDYDIPSDEWISIWISVWMSVTFVINPLYLTNCTTHLLQSWYSDTDWWLPVLYSFVYIYLHVHDYKWANLYIKFRVSLIHCSTKPNFR